MRSPPVLGLVCTLVSLGCGRPLVSGEDSTSGPDEQTSSTTGSTDPTTNPTTDPSTTETSATETGESETGPVPFVPDSDIVSDTCSCDSWLQDCPEGEKCVPALLHQDSETWDCTLCVPVLGSEPTEAACTYDGPSTPTDSCDEHNVCWDAHLENGEWVGGVCREFCDGNPDEPICPPGSYCLDFVSAVNLCLPPCDPLVQDCGPGQACVWGSSNFYCLHVEARAIGEPCSQPHHCEPGSLCLDGAMLPACLDADCCTPICDITVGDGDCAALPGSVCVAMFELDAAPPGQDDVGVCVLPP